MTDVQVSPVVKTLDLKCGAAQAFDYFTVQMADWWPLHKHAISPPKTGKPAKSCVMEPRVGGRVYEVGADGKEHEWGEVRVWEPGKRVVWSWHAGRAASQATEVELSFEETGEEKCCLKLEHRGWEILGEDGPDIRAGYAGGWDAVIFEHFNGYVEERARAA